MSIDSEVTSMTQNIQADYEGLENIGADLTGINKNILNIRTILDNIYNDMPKVTGEGTEVTLTPTRKGRLALIPKGNSTQESTTGKNLFNYATDFYGNIALANYITNNNDGTFTTTGLGGLVTSITKTLNAGTYTISLQAYEGYSLGSMYIRNTGGSNGTPTYTFTLAEETTMTFDIRVYTDIVKFYIMLESGSTKHDYEQYTGGIPAPNPSYPFPIKSVTGDNEIVVNNKNICTSTNITGYNRNLRFYFDNKLLANTFTLSFITNEDLSNQTLTIQDETTSTNIAQFSSAVTGTANTKVIVTKTLTNEQLQAIQNTSDTICMIIYKGTANFTSITEAQIENNSTNTTYEAYTQVTKPLNLGTIELNKIGNYQDYIYKTSGKNLCSSYLEANVDQYGKIVSDSRYHLGIAQVKQGETYTFSGVAEGTSLVAFYTSEPAINSVSYNNSRTVLTNIKTFIADITGYVVFRGAITETRLMLNIGSSALPYEPYGSGNWYKKEIIKKLVLNGSETYQHGGTRFNYELDMPVGIYESLSNQFITTTDWTTHTLTNNTLCVARVVESWTKGRISINTTNFSSVEELKTWLALHNLIVYYQLAEATDIEITDTSLIEQLEEIDKMQGYNGTTIITSTYDTNNAQMIISASGLKGE